MVERDDVVSRVGAGGWRGGGGGRRTRELELNRLSAPKDKSVPSSCGGVNLQPTRKGEF